MILGVTRVTKTRSVIKTLRADLNVEFLARVRMGDNKWSDSASTPWPSDLGSDSALWFLHYVAFDPTCCTCGAL